MSDKIIDRSGRVKAVIEDGETVYNREESKKEIQAETLAQLYEMDELSQSAIEKIKDNRPEVYSKAYEKVTGKKPPETQ